MGGERREGDEVKPTFFFCGICNGKRDNVGGLCSGCGGDVDQVRMSANPKPVAPKCPQCGPRTDAYRLDRGSYHCRRCGAEFAPVEFGFLDSRPDRNAERMENRERSRRKA
jgi:ribosomal protein L37AE/L43A